MKENILVCKELAILGIELYWFTPVSYYNTMFCYGLTLDSSVNTVPHILPMLQTPITGYAYQEKESGVIIYDKYYKT